MLRELLSNQVLQASLTAWLLAQLLKIPLDYAKTRRINWVLLLRAGGFPSSHTALVVSTAVSIGLNFGFDSPVFAVAIAVAMIISYDASGVRRQAGLHAEKINLLINELLKGHPISEIQLKVVLGHTHREVLGGAVLGMIIAVLFWWLLP